MRRTDAQLKDDALLDIPCKRWKTRQAIVLDWADGPREGLCALAVPEYEFYFELHSEKPSSDDLDDRLYLLSRVRAGSVERVTKALASLGKSKRLVWAPQWNFADDAARIRAEAVLASVLKSKRRTGLIVRTRDMIQFTDCLSVSRDIKKFLTWFEYKGQHAS